MKDKKIEIGLTILILITIGIICCFGTQGRGVTINGKYISSEKRKEYICVYINGEVNKEGVVNLKKDATLKQALEKSDGLTANADIDKIEFDRKLTDGEKIYIEGKNLKGTEEKMYENNITLNDNNKVNINTANKEELKSLEGIGDKTAESIITYRENIEFKSVEDIMNINGIGKAKFEKIKDKICVK